MLLWSSAALALREETEREERAEAKRVGEMGREEEDIVGGVVRVEVVEVEEERCGERRVVFRESRKVVRWLDYQESVGSEEEKTRERRGVARVVRKAGAWWRKTWESNKVAAAAAGGIM